MILINACPQFTYICFDACFVLRHASDIYITRIRHAFDMYIRVET